MRSPALYSFPHSSSSHGSVPQQKSNSSIGKAGWTYVCTLREALPLSSLKRLPPTYPNIRHRAGMPFSRERGCSKMTDTPANLSAPWRMGSVYAHRTRETPNLGSRARCGYNSETWVNGYLSCIVQRTSADQALQSLTLLRRPERFGSVRRGSGRLGKSEPMPVSV